MPEQAQRYEFRGDAKEILDLMIHSVYSHKEIFLRELISNASDALDKMRFEAVRNPELARYTQDPHIRLEPNKENRTLTVHDNGIGMSRDEIVEFIGTIAKSGSKEFLDIIKKGKTEDLPPELIGQFGVGFYASFMVADKITMITRRAGEEQAHRWESGGDGAYTITEAERDAPGTSITLHLKDPDTEDELDDFTEEWVIRNAVRKYSDFVAYPIRMRVERKEVERDEQGKPREGAEEKTVVKDEVLNTMQAIWTRPESEVEEKDYNEFYHHISHDWNDPLKRISYKAEGTHEFRSLLFIPSKAPYDLYMREGAHGVQLYIRRVFIMSDCKDLIPEYMRFIRGVVDSEDLSLNISREILQKNRQIQAIRKALTRKILDELKKMKQNDWDQYLTFWTEFGPVLKEGLFQDAKNREALLELSLYRSTHNPDEWTTLEDYLGRMKEGQDNIYFITGESVQALRNSPKLEAFRDKGYEALLMTDAVDEIWTQQVFEYKEKQLRSVSRGLIELGTEEERKHEEEERKEQEKTHKPLLDAIKEKLGDRVKFVRLSSRLTSSPVCLVSDEQDISPALEQMLRAAGQEAPEVKRILEINPKHPIMEKLEQVYDRDRNDPRIAEFSELLYGQALLADGTLPPDPGEFSRRIADLMTKSL